MSRAGFVMWAGLTALYTVPTFAACRPEAWMCSSPMQQTAPNPLDQLNAEDKTLFERGHFALQRDDSNPLHSELRPVIKFGQDTHMSLRLGRGHSEVKWKWRF